ncbi:aminopeptidase P family protein [Tissierella sp. Yu-01]|uniref:aminopeptidase P family protein n=1 Tax=Tissierella sp. Yu-01 TaxID=3035694 RepID=UPI00240E63D8|nr:aminopeptidase P family protein [Tissierella sp. Yu-01]WFA09158.1 aminopeptidase P family protein [Tissierella sp. Yu-01]
MNINERLDKLRALMAERGITAYIEPTSDPHQSEYVADYYKGRDWISGFTGSAGTVVITKDEAILWTDGRYFIQAEKQISGSDFKLFKMNTPGYPTYMEWLETKLKDGDSLGFNGKVFAQSLVEELEEELNDKNIVFIDEFDLIGEVWEGRPEIPCSKIFALDTKYVGKSAKDKIKEVREYMLERGAYNFLLGSLDDIAWLYNIRGNDVLNNPVVISYALISKEKANLFVDKKKVDDEVKGFLYDNGVEVQEYNEIINFVEDIKESSKLILAKDKINRWLYKAIPNNVSVIDEMNITTKLKGIKNSDEIKNQKIAYIKDCVALVKYFHWIDKNMGKVPLNEFSAQEKLLEFRQEQESFLEPSFSTISAYGENAAMMHYSASADKNAEFKEEGLYLVDSGGQYFEGTTDITRTVALGPITDEEKKDFTLTLKGHINLISARFLHGTSGHVLDILSRYPLWQEGIDYKCGTGHGVGYLLNVHEGPHRFAVAPNNVALEKGMIITIEPGVYKEGKHGIRIENVVVVDEDIKTDSGQFMKFEVLSYCPIDLDCIDADMLLPNEREWLNNYHKEVYEKLSPYLSEEERDWLKHETRSI